MIEEITATLETSKPKRPFWVWAFTVYTLIFAGILPVFGAIALWASGRFAEYTSTILITLILDTGIIILSVLTWKGNNTARILFLIFVTVHYLLLGYSNFELINSGQISEDDLPQVWGRVFRGIISPAVNIWYFTQAKTRGFFKQ